MKMSSKFVIRLGVWCVLMLYLFLDLIVFEGPLKKQVYRLQGTPTEKLGNDIERGIVARVFTKPISLSQVDYAVDSYLWRRGRERSDVSDSERLTLRKSALRELCDHVLLREKVALNTEEFPVSDEEITAAMQRFASRFTTPDQLSDSMQAFGFQGEKELRFRIAARLQQQKYLEHFIAPGIAVSEEEAQAWYDAHIADLTTPELRNARHIFLAKLENTEEDARAKLTQALETLESNQSDFSTLCAQLSEDPRTKDKGGELDWMRAERLPKDFAKALFALQLNTPTLVETSIGWHLLELTAIQAPQLRSFDACKEEIVAAIETTRRKDAVHAYRRNLRRQHDDKIVIHEQLLDAPWSH